MSGRSLRLRWSLFTDATRGLLWNIGIKHYNDVIMGTIASQITSLTIVNSTVYSGADQRKHQSSASLAFVRGIHRGPVNSPHKWPVTRKMFPFDDVIMISVFLSTTLFEQQLMNTCHIYQHYEVVYMWAGFSGTIFVTGEMYSVRIEVPSINNSFKVENVKPVLRSVPSPSLKISL